MALESAPRPKRLPLPLPKHKRLRLQMEAQARLEAVEGDAVVWDNTLEQEDALPGEAEQNAVAVVKAVEQPEPEDEPVCEDVEKGDVGHVGEAVETSGERRRCLAMPAE